MIRLKSLLIESSATYTLYVDMGGVLFKKMGADAGGKGTKTEYIGNTLWNAIKNLDPIILSAVDSDVDGKKKETKRKQVADHLTPTPSIKFVTKGTDKGNDGRANKNSILIDDDDANITSWKSKGGIGILHKSTDVQATIKQLKKYFDLD
jgi:hypothetical protein